MDAGLERWRGFDEQVQTAGIFERAGSKEDWEWFTKDRSATKNDRWNWSNRANAFRDVIADLRKIHCFFLFFTCSFKKIDQLFIYVRYVLDVLISVHVWLFAAPIKRNK